MSNETEVAVTNKPQVRKNDQSDDVRIKDGVWTRWNMWWRNDVRKLAHGVTKLNEDQSDKRDVPRKRRSLSVKPKKGSRAYHANGRQKTEAV
jgi:hypothetical protein